MIIVRPALSVDVPMIWRQFAHRDGFTTSSRISFYDEEELEYWADDPQSILLVAKVKGVYAGLAFVKFISPSWAMLDGFYVIDEYRGKGVSEAMILEIEARLRCKGIEYLQTVVSDARAIPYMKRRGFEQCGNYTWFEKWITGSKHQYEPGTRLGCKPKSLEEQQ